jgi:hypothetical protein
MHAKLFVELGEDVGFGAGALGSQPRGNGGALLCITTSAQDGRKPANHNSTGLLKNVVQLKRKLLIIRNRSRFRILPYRSMAPVTKETLVEF